MERLTARNENGKREAFYPYCFREDTCDGNGGGEKCKTCEFMFRVCETLAKYEDTGLTPPEVMELKERDTAKAPNVSKDKYSDTYICPSCNYTLIHKDETGYFCGRKYIFCPECGQRLKWED